MTGAHLSKWSWDVIVTSPLSRALETAKLVGDATRVEILNPLDDLQERDYGDSAGLTLEESAVRWPDGRIPGIESYELLQERGFSTLASLAARFPKKRVVVVSHGGLINSILAAVSNGEIGSGKTRLSNACISLISYQPPKWNIDEFNSVEHLNAASDEESNASKW